ncbi:MAG TPA: IS110 family transposase [Actinomycetota bacterium]|nr:IS110 family transposase [Actinomycetota bacterium]
MARSIVTERDGVVVGVDTHADIHVAVVLSSLGARLGSRLVATTPAGFGELVDWASGFGPVRCFGVEGTGSYGAALARHLRAVGHTVVEVDRPDRRTRRLQGKSDPVDAEAAARAVLAGTASGCPKAGDGRVEMIRSLRVARRSALKARTQATNQLLALVLTSPEELRASLRSMSVPRLVRVATRFRPGPLLDPSAATKLALRHLARRHAALSAEIGELDRVLAQVVSEAAPGLLALPGVGTDVAGALLVAAGDNPERLSSEAAFARLCGVAPLPASSGKTNRHRLNRGGDRIANNALWRIVLVRMSSDPRTRNYVDRRTKEGLSKKEIIRCLKRYVAREVHRRLVGVDEQ